jgi:3-hydroxyisobutyrate dehydrogenase-like beta-hydroxyacid dehydrogenase
VNEIIASGDIAGKVVVDTSTVHPDSSVAASKRLAEKNALFVAGRF